MWIAIAIVATIALFAGLGLGFASGRLPSKPGDLEERVNGMLPQTQCTECGYAGCRPYARAVAAGEAEINLCPPGGEETVRRLANLLGKDVLPLAKTAVAGQQLAIIDEARCIGCTHCRDVCPVDAIVGAQQLMHTVIEGECTGCELCLAACPVDCIDLRTVS